MAKRTFEVEAPEVYESYPLTSTAELSDAGKAKHEFMVQTRPGTSDKRAVWIVHGMGQQVRYETLEALTGGLLDAASRAFPGRDIPAPTFGEMQVGSTVLQRVKVRLPTGDGGLREVHLYESYWAPKTEGVVNLKEVIGFLWDGGSRGLINCFTHFQRALFGAMVAFKTHWRTPLYLLGTLAVLAALMAINLVILATGGKFLGLGQTATLSDPVVVGALTSIGDIVSCIALTFGCVLFLAEACRPGAVARRIGDRLRQAREHREKKKESEPGATVQESSPLRKAHGVLLTYAIWVGVGLTAGSIIAAALGMLWTWNYGVPNVFTTAFREDACLLANSLTLVTLVVVGIGVWVRRTFTSSFAPGDSRVLAYLGLYLVFVLTFVIHLALVGGIVWLAVTDAPLAGWTGIGLLASTLWVWPFLIMVSAMARALIVQFVGDVTVYIASNKIDRFDAVRQAIKKLAKDDASAVFSAKAHGSTDFEYEKVAIVGHSLGSVIAYDTLNRLAADDALSNHAADITGRTAGLLTFGSPLDKIAFFFTIMSNRSSHVREQLAAVAQPLIEDVRLRTLVPWTNIYSLNDVICGALDFYDGPGLPKKHWVDNLEDEDAIIPLIAHVEYWSNTKLWDELLLQVMR